MAEGGYDPTDATTEKDPLIPNTEDEDDDTDPWDNLYLSEYPATDDQPPGDTDSMQPFEPGAASTPAGEQVPMATRTRLPQESRPRTAETSFIEGDTQRQRLRTMLENEAWNEVELEFENAKKDKLDVRYKGAARSGRDRGGSVIMVKMKGKETWYRLYTKSRGDTKESLKKSLPDESKRPLGYHWMSSLLKQTQHLPETRKNWLQNKWNKGLLRHKNSGATWTP